MRVDFVFQRKTSGIVINPLVVVQRMFFIDYLSNIGSGSLVVRVVYKHVQKALKFLFAYRLRDTLHEIDHKSSKLLMAYCLLGH